MTMTITGSCSRLLSTATAPRLSAVVLWCCCPVVRCTVARLPTAMYTL